MYVVFMYYLSWSHIKNKELLEERGLSFEDVVVAINDDRVLDDKPHPNKVKYPSQRLLVVDISGYACVVPYVINAEEIFLKLFTKVERQPISI